LGFFVWVALGVLDSVGLDVGFGPSGVVVGSTIAVAVGVGIDVGVTGVNGTAGVVGAAVGDGATIGSAAAGLPPEKKVMPSRPAPLVSTTVAAMGTRRRRRGERGTYMAIGRSGDALAIIRPDRLGSAERLI
jgi:hypothetical protein